jgi:hypothetical protein
MSTPKQSRRKPGTKKLEPIDWHEFANDAVLHGNMSTLYRRPPDEDPSAYASEEALLEIEKRLPQEKVADSGPDPLGPTVGSVPTEGDIPTALSGPADGSEPTVGPQPIETLAHGIVPAVGIEPTVGLGTTVGITSKKKVRPIRDLQDALTLAGQVLYKAMYASLDDGRSKSCTKGYRQLAAETHLDKDTVRDLISEFKEKGIVRETGTYDPDTRSSKTYEVFSSREVLPLWREAGIRFVTTGRQRPTFCTSTGAPVVFRPTVGLNTT